MNSLELVTLNISACLQRNKVVKAVSEYRLLCHALSLCLTE